MQWLAIVPDWLVWCAAGGVGVLAVAALARLIESALELETR